MFKRSSNALRTWVVMGVGAFVLALSVFALLATLAPDTIFAQTPLPVMLQHEENDSGPVTTFLAEDPEGADIGLGCDGHRR